jgi:hypothetical protein
LALLAYVEANPGSGARQAARAMGGIPLTPTLHHLDLLRRHGLLQETRRGRRLLFHLPGQTPRFALRPPESAVLEWVSLHPGQIQKAVLGAMQGLHGWPSATTRYRLRRLVHDGYLHATKTGRTVAYRIAGASIPLHAHPARQEAEGGLTAVD